MMTGFDLGLGMAGGWLWLIIGTVFIVTIVGLALGAIRDRNDTVDTVDTVDDPARILKARLARGELSPQQYEQARRLLGL